MRMIELSDMFKGREKELYIILSLPSVIYLLTKRKIMFYSFSFLKSCVCDTQVTLFSFYYKFIPLRMLLTYIYKD